MPHSLPTLKTSHRVYAQDRPCPNTHFRGQDPINSIWISHEIEVISATYLPYDPKLSNLRPTEANITMGSLLGKHRPRIKPPQTRRLNSKIEIKIKRIHHSYIDRLEKHFKKYHILVQLEVLEKDAGFPASEEGTRALEGLDKQVTLFMLNAKRKCRKIYVGEYEVSPQVKTRIDRYRALR